MIATIIICVPAMPTEAHIVFILSIESSFLARRYIYRISRSSSNISHGKSVVGGQSLIATIIICVPAMPTDIQTDRQSYALSVCLCVCVRYNR